jgi:hypothetical protein
VRLIGYGWPLFWVFLPWLLHEARLRIHPLETALLAAASLAVAWWPNVEGLWDMARKCTPWLLGIPVAYLATGQLLRRVEARSNEPAPFGRQPRGAAAGA